MLQLLVTLLISTTFCFGQSEVKDSGQNPGFPRVVARVNLFNRTKAIGPQTLYTPKQSGVFRLSGTINVTVGNGESGTWYLSGLWANEVASNNGSTIAIVGTNVPQSGTPISPVVFNASKGTPISIQTDGGSTSGTQYNIYVILEQLE
jgi:hypothetical protein